MIKVSSQTFFIISIVFIFLISSFIWYLILYQAIGFLGGLAILSFLVFLTFWQNFLGLRRVGELTRLKSRKRIFIVSAVIVLGFSELIWSISFMPFSFFILGGILSIIFGVVLDIFKEYFKKSTIGDLYAKKENIKNILIRDITTGIVLITIFIFINPWLPLKAS